ncbi:MAG: hypothetical protein HXS54_05845 [Theionarchaea archaeon]|nr:hypothetical protein [Theionarchaea archaeon]
MKDITGYGILIMSGGINNIFIKSLMGRPEDIDKGDVLTAILEIGGAYGFGEAAKLIGKLPVVGGALTKVGGGLDDLLKSVMKFGITDDAAKAVDDALKAGLKETIEETGELGAKQAGKAAGKLAEEATEGAAKAGAKAAGEAGEAISKSSEQAWETFGQALSRGEFSSIDDIIKYLRAEKVPENMISSFVKEFGRTAGTPGDKAISAFAKTSNAYSGILGNVLGRLRLLPVVGSVFTKLGGLGAVVGGVYVLDRLASAEAFGGFYIEERDQLATFALMYDKGDYQGMASTIAEQAIFMLEAGDLYFNSPHLAEYWPITTITYNQAKDYHQESFRRYVEGHINDLVKAGAWVKDGSNNGLGRPALPDEISSFLQSQEGKKYAKHYEDYYETLKESPEGRVELYNLWKGGYIPEYLIGEDLVYEFSNAFDAEKNALERSAANELDPDMVISAVKSFLFESKKSAVWSDKSQIETAMRYGNLLNTLIKNGTLTDINTKILLDQYTAKMIGITGQNIEWKTLDRSEMGTPIGIPKTEFYMAETRKPTTLGFSQDAGNTVTTTETTDQGSVVKTDAPTKPGATASAGVSIPTRPTESARADYGGAMLTDSEYLWLNQIKAGNKTEDELKRLYPQIYASLESKGLVGKGVEGLPRQEVTGIDQPREPAKPEISQEDLIKTVNALQQMGVSNKEIEAVVKETARELGTEGYFEYPSGGYTPELLQAMLASPKPEERSTAKQSLERLKTKAAPPKEGGAYGYTRTEVKEKPLSEEEARKETIEASYYTPDISAQALQEIYDYLKAEGTSPTKAISADLSDEAKKAVFGSLGITEYKPRKEGYGTTYGVGRRTTGR